MMIKNFLLLVMDLILKACAFLINLISATILLVFILWLISLFVSCRTEEKSIEEPGTILKPIYVHYYHYVDDGDTVWHRDSMKVFFNLNDTTN